MPTMATLTRFGTRHAMLSSLQCRRPNFHSFHHHCAKSSPFRHWSRCFVGCNATCEALARPCHKSTLGPIRPRQARLSSLQCTRTSFPSFDTPTHCAKSSPVRHSSAKRAPESVIPIAAPQVVVKLVEGTANLVACAQERLPYRPHTPTWDS